MTKNDAIRITLLALMSVLLWLTPLIWSFPLPAHYNIGSQKLTSMDIEVWDLWFYFPVLATMVVMTAFVSRRIMISRAVLAFFIGATVLGQIAGMSANLLLRPDSELIDDFIPFGLLVVPVLYTIVVMPFGTLLFMVAHAIFGRHTKELLAKTLSH